MTTTAPPNLPKMAKPWDIFAAVASESGVSLEEITGELRHPAVVRARRALMVLLRAHTLLSYPCIAVLIRPANTTHSGVLTTHKDARRVLDTNADPKLAELIARVRTRLGLADPASSTTPPQHG